MEDSHSVHLYLPPASSKSPTKPSSPSSSSDIPTQPAGSTVTNDEIDTDGNALICVFDGHGGSTVAKFTGTTLHSRLAALDAYSEPVITTLASTLTSPAELGDYASALKEVFLKTDEDLRAGQLP